MNINDADREWLAENGFASIRENSWDEFFSRRFGKTVITVGVPLRTDLGCFAVLSFDTDEFELIETKRRESAKEAVEEAIEKVKTLMNDLPDVRDFLMK